MVKLTDSTKGSLIRNIINILNEGIERDNENLRSGNLYSDQKPYHGGDMFLKLAYMSDDQIKKIAAACGI